tara:strand:+ start:4820 stop:8380 length:3561 start_codon:yes stop_codon:yes gene_type:complete
MGGFAWINMSLNGLFNVLTDVGAYNHLISALKSSKSDAFSTIICDSAKPFVIGAIWQDINHTLLVVCPRPEDARQLVTQLDVYFGEESPIFHFPELEVIPYERVTADRQLEHQRLVCLNALSRHREYPSPLVVTSNIALMQRTIETNQMRELSKVIKTGDRINVEFTLESWANMGYKYEEHVHQKGSFARRGGIIDIFSPQMKLPARLELWGDEIEAIRLFDPLTQRSIRNVEELLIIPAQELLPNYANHDLFNNRYSEMGLASIGTKEKERIAEELADISAGITVQSSSLYSGFFQQNTLLDHIDENENILAVINEPAETKQTGIDWQEKADGLLNLKQKRFELPLGFSKPYFEWEHINSILAKFKTLGVTRYQMGSSNEPFLIPIYPAPRFNSNLLKFGIAADQFNPFSINVIATQHAQRLIELLQESDVPAIETDEMKLMPSSSKIHVIRNSADGGWILRPEPDSDNTLALFLTDKELFGYTKKGQRKRRENAANNMSLFLDDLSPGQFVVHIEHGIARFSGTQFFDHDAGENSAQEYLVLDYAADDRLYLPLEQIGRISIYSGGDENAPVLTRLGSSEWSRKIQRAKDSTRRLAFDLIAIQAQRETEEGHSFSSDTIWQYEMEDAFPYIETDDQIAAIANVKEDMERPKPMDRLICGDVGYGKTEVALRAIFKAVMDGKQAAILVPTTVLAQQHFQTFTERLGPYPIKLEVLSRFKNAREQNDVISRLKSGAIDIVIGTHRLVQSDVGFKDLGLVVIDEEHRFGVNHKEKLKDLRRSVDVLSLTATPIPRTLHMALAGMRDISNLETPPEERLPIKTYLAESSSELVQEAIKREIDRGGQIYYLHNRISSINFAAGSLKELVPDLRVVVAHGQLPEDELAKTMEVFIDGRADVLVCTTIIESGLDIPTVNTLIVDRPDRLGLSQLYQLRGRIGRGSLRGHAYLIVEPGRSLTEIAQKRLEAIVAANELGSGFRIAMRDLEIRGAGNLLGAEQSGHIHAVGFDLYTRLLSEAVQELQKIGPSELKQENQDPVIDLQIPSSIPADLINDLATRIGVYQRMAKLKTIDSIDDLENELGDRYGKNLPMELSNLMVHLRIKVLSREVDVEALTRRKNEITLKLKHPVGGARVPLERALGFEARVGHQQIKIVINLKEKWLESIMSVLQALNEFREKYNERDSVLNYR